mmetsp:Transcript_26745/g.70248  ORF Transcript_26745/g.70248 Transcript_26745/m.70248 type:complete len:203 (-) Transcript_26745:613-1221(-)
MKSQQLWSVSASRSSCGLPRISSKRSQNQRSRSPSLSLLRASARQAPAAVSILHVWRSLRVFGNPPESAGIRRWMARRRWRQAVAWTVPGSIRCPPLGDVPTSLKAAVRIQHIECLMRRGWRKWLVRGCFPARRKAVSPKGRSWIESACFNLPCHGHETKASCLDWISFLSALLAARENGCTYPGHAHRRTSAAGSTSKVWK